MALNFAGVINNSNISQAKKDVVINDFCNILGYSDTVYDPITKAQIPNPETRAAFFNQYIIKHIKSTVQKHRRIKAREAVVINETDLDF